MNESPASIRQYISDHHAVLVAISKTRPPEEILDMYKKGQRIFGENKVQELTDKQSLLPPDIEWHLVGHLQSNKVKYIAGFVSLIHSVDSIRLMEEINKQGKKHDRVLDVLLQIYIAQEETKFGLSFAEALDLLQNKKLSAFQHVRIRGMMGMATFTENELQVRKEFRSLKDFFDNSKTLQSDNFQPDILSMGMSGDYKIALDEGSNMVRIGTALFGSRD